MKAFVKNSEPHFLICWHFLADSKERFRFLLISGRMNAECRIRWKINPSQRWSISHSGVQGVLIALSPPKITQLSTGKADKKGNMPLPFLILFPCTFYTGPPYTHFRRCHLLTCQENCMAESWKLTFCPAPAQSMFALWFSRIGVLREYICFLP